jgi:hypothetical protein
MQRHCGLFDEVVSHQSEGWGELLMNGFHGDTLGFEPFPEGLEARIVGEEVLQAVSSTYPCHITVKDWPHLFDSSVEL